MVTLTTDTINILTFHQSDININFILIINKISSSIFIYVNTTFTNLPIRKVYNLSQFLTNPPHNLKYTSCATSGYIFKS